MKHPTAILLLAKASFLHLWLITNSFEAYFHKRITLHEKFIAKDITNIFAIICKACQGISVLQRENY